MERVVIVGGSLAGLRAAETFRRDGFTGELHVVGDEARLPYDRPPLSKQVLAGSWDVERVALLDDAAAAALDATWHLGRRATALDPVARTVALADGEVLAYDGVVIATGARPRTLPASPPGVHTLRTIDDALALRAELDAAPGRVVVIGAGFIGAEVAATVRGRGIDVTMVEALPRPLERALGAEVGQIVVDLHRDHGVDVRTGVGVERFVGADRVEGIVLADGTTVDADVVVVGIGVVPNTEWLEGSGLVLDNGVLCDETCLAAPGVVAAGDVARWPNPRFGESMRVEHWDNAVEQGVYAARRLLAGEGHVEPFAPIPWFWTDQYDAKIQLAGRAGERFEIVHGSVEERRFAGVYGRGDRLVGGVGFNRPRQVMQVRQAIDEGITFDEAVARLRSQ